MTIDPEFKQVCEQAPEILLYYTISSLGAFMWKMQHDLADGRIEESELVAKDLILAQEKIEFAVDQIKRFGVEKPKDNGRATPEYWAWFRWWDQYAKSLSDEDFRKLDQALTAKENVDAWHPHGDWRNESVTVAG